MPNFGEDQIYSRIKHEPHEWWEQEIKQVQKERDEARAELKKARVLCSERYEYKVSAEYHKRCAEQAWRERDEARAEVKRLRAAIRETLTENKHLADGENCTLKRLVEALGEGDE